MSEINDISTHTGPPGFKVVEPKGPAASAGVTVRETGEIGESVRDTEVEPPTEVKSGAT